MQPYNILVASEELQAKVCPAGWNRSGTTFPWPQWLTIHYVYCSSHKVVPQNVSKNPHHSSMLIIDRRVRPSTHALLNSLGSQLTARSEPMMRQLPLPRTRRPSEPTVCIWYLAIASTCSILRQWGGPKPSWGRSEGLKHLRNTAQLRFHSIVSCFSYSCPPFRFLNFSFSAFLFHFCFPLFSRFPNPPGVILPLRM